jgi:hypothetical protein
MEEGRVEEAGDIGGEERPVVSLRGVLFTVPPFSCASCVGRKDFTTGGRVSSMGESGGGGMSVPSVREYTTGVSCGSSKRPLDLPLIGIVALCNPGNPIPARR